MNRSHTLLFLASIGVCFLTTVYAASPATTGLKPMENSYHVFTKSLKIDDSGVGPIPSRFQWSVETCVAGIDVEGNALPDSRVMLRLYDPDHNFTAITAQMNLKTAENLQRQLAKIISKKRENPSFQHRPNLYDPSMIPSATMTNIDENEVATIQLDPEQAN